MWWFMQKLCKSWYTNIELDIQFVYNLRYKYKPFLIADVLNEKVLPVIISMRNGGLNEDVLVSARSLLLPIIRLKVQNSANNIICVYDIFQIQNCIIKPVIDGLFSFLYIFDETKHLTYATGRIVLDFHVMKTYYFNQSKWGSEPACH